MEIINAIKRKRRNERRKGEIQKKNIIPRTFPVTMRRNRDTMLIIKKSRNPTTPSLDANATPLNYIPPRRRKRRSLRENKKYREVILSSLSLSMYVQHWWLSLRYLLLIFHYVLFLPLPPISYHNHNIFFYSFIVCFPLYHFLLLTSLISLLSFLSCFSSITSRSYILSCHNIHSHLHSQFQVSLFSSYLSFY